MDRILRADAGWEDRIADALRGSARPIPLDERFVPRGPDGLTNRDRYDRSAMPPPRPASTLLAVYPGGDGRLVIPLTVRRAELRSHAGEVSLPGGALEPGDVDRQAAALREAWEEIGLDPVSVRVVGWLDDVWIPVSNYELRPFVGLLTERPALVPQAAEVASIVEMPLAALHDAEVVAVEDFEVRGVTIRAGAYRFGGIRVWGATAITLAMLGTVLAEASGSAPRGGGHDA